MNSVNKKLSKIRSAQYELKKMVSDLVDDDNIYSVRAVLSMSEFLRDECEVNDYEHLNGTFENNVDGMSKLFSYHDTTKSFDELVRLISNGYGYNGHDEYVVYDEDNGISSISASTFNASVLECRDEIVDRIIDYIGIDRTIGIILYHVLEQE